jgi:mannose-6-phosphate isomerase-like protein (cupin superfamily)
MLEVHKKEWGEEHWLANGDFCCKELILNEGYRCSLHFHKNKDELFYVVKGKVLLELAGDRIVLLPGLWARVKPNEPHRFSGILDSIIIESSTHHEECDSYRIEPSGRMDRYENTVSC